MVVLAADVEILSGHSDRNFHKFLREADNLEERLDNEIRHGRLSLTVPWDVNKAVSAVIQRRYVSAGWCIAVVSFAPGKTAAGKMTKPKTKFILSLRSYDNRITQRWG